MCLVKLNSAANQDSSSFSSYHHSNDLLNYKYFGHKDNKSEIVFELRSIDYDPTMR